AGVTVDDLGKLVSVGGVRVERGYVMVAADSVERYSVSRHRGLLRVGRVERLPAGGSGVAYVGSATFGLPAGHACLPAGAQLGVGRGRDTETGGRLGGGGDGVDGFAVDGAGWGGHFRSPSPSCCVLPLYVY